MSIYLTCIPMSIEESWAIVDAVREQSHREPSDVIEADIAMMNILKHWDTETHNKAAGYSARFPRYQKVYDDKSPIEELSILREHYWARHRELGRLQRLIEEKERTFQSTCTHDWERDMTSRGHRSRYICNRCGAYR